MQFEHDFTVPTTRNRALELLLDVERIAPCLPGAELTELIDERNFKGRVSVRLGAISLSFRGDVEIVDVDVEDHRVVMHARGREARGKGSAEATVTSRLFRADQGTRVSILADLKLAGPVAQFGHGMIEDVSARLMEQFAECVRAQLVGGEQAQAALREAERPLRGLSLALMAILGTLRRLLGRLIPRRDETTKE